MFKRQACVFISFYFGAADRLNAEERQRTITLASKITDWAKAKKVVQDDFLTIDLLEQDWVLVTRNSEDFRVTVMHQGAKDSTPV